MRGLLAIVVAAGCHSPRVAPDGAVPEPEDAGPDGPPPRFVHVEDGRLVDGDGEPLLLRAMGMGNWLLPEGYMWQLSGARGDRPRRIETRIVELVGEEKAAAFWEGYRDAFLTESDIARMAELGFNAIRIALNARDLDAAMFERLDRAVEWCRNHRVYVVFDMHAAPGGQTGRNIDDSPDDVPELFTDAANEEELVRLWREIAERYAGDPIVLGYDLLNEPIAPEWDEHNDRLWPIYVRVAAAIREVDPDHTLIVEGAQWANNWSALDAPFDDNLVYSFHKYWDDTSAASIQGYLDHRTEWGRPLWVGEIGENDDQWYREAFSMLEGQDVGWSFWTWKKLDSGNNPYAIEPPARWDLIQAFVENANAQPSAEVAQEILDELVENVAIERCRYNEGPVCAVVPCP
jgi:endoglucanase